MDRESNQRACAEYEALLEDHLGGALAGLDAKDTAEHLERCAGCRAALEKATASVRLLRVRGATTDLGPGFARMVMARIRAEQQESTGAIGVWQLFVSLGWRFAATATLAVAVLLAYDVTLGKPIQVNVASARPAEVHDIFAPDPAGVPASRDEILMMVAETSHGNH
jgi:predicted anti-sigma-YlaC factor YlaD